jgi:hypothetical protein
MTLIQKRKKVKDIIEKADEHLLNEIIRFVEAEDKKRVGYKINGADLTQGELTQIVHEAETRYHKGEYITHDKARKQSKNWK